MALDDGARRALATARVLTLAFVVACILYVLVAVLVHARPEPLPPERRAVLVPALLVMAVMGVAASFFVRSAVASRGGRSLGSWFTAVILAMTLREGAAVVGLVLSLLIGQTWPVIACSALATGALLLGFPRASELEDHLRR